MKFIPGLFLLVGGCALIFYRSYNETYAKMLKEISGR
jgi:Na+/melibiose symporter-like transporter